ncbi:ribose-phosphate pyrophosphokinase [Haliangium sp.]|uniref:ribose-phosphate pyrophosphokinase n=1 Tax=Haliangium sp. TaxID=2663208 RepID=UPI003D0F1B8B
MSEEASLSPVVLAVPGNEALAGAVLAGLPAELGAELGACTIREFPDGELYVRVDTPVAQRRVAIACTLDQPKDKILPLLFLAATCRDLGAAAVGLVAPYLAFMRQDERFRSGEGITSAYFAGLLSRAVDWLVTVDPHLHRWRSLDQIYTIPSRVASAAPAIAAWLRQRGQAPVLIGPDAESEQWVAAVAAELGAPHVILSKVRHGDREVAITAPDLALCQGRTPVLIDDIISTGQTMVAAIEHIARAGLPAPVCVGVHPVFADQAYDELRAAGAGEVVSCNTIAHASNQISIDAAVAAATAEFLR